MTLASTLADGTSYSVNSKLRMDGSVPIFTPLYRRLGAIQGELAFSDLPDSDVSEVSGTKFLWVRPALSRASYYPDGWKNGILVNAVGTKYAGLASLNFGQGAAGGANGNARLVFNGGLLEGEQNKRVIADPATAEWKPVPPPDGNNQFSLDLAMGVFTGSFRHTDATTNTFRGILLNKGANKGGFGFFLTTPPTNVGASGQSGDVLLKPGLP